MGIIIFTAVLVIMLAIGIACVSMSSSSSTYSFTDEEFAEAFFDAFVWKGDNKDE